MAEVSAMMDNNSPAGPPSGGNLSTVVIEDVDSHLAKKGPKHLRFKGDPEMLTALVANSTATATILQIRDEELWDPCQVKTPILLTERPLDPGGIQIQEIVLFRTAPNDGAIEPVASTFNLCTYCSTGSMRRLHGGPHDIYLCTYCSTGSIMREHGGPNDRAIEPVAFTLKMLANPASDDE